MTRYRSPNTLSDRELRSLTTFAVRISEYSGRIARRYFRSPVQVDNKSGTHFDPVTVADREIEDYLRRRIHADWPGHAIVGEERGGQATDGLTWIVDPIDGTRGFITGSPMWGTLTGLMGGGVPLLGVMHQPVLRETFYGNRLGAWYRQGGRGRRLHTRNTKRLADAVLYSTHPGMFQAKDREIFEVLDSRVSFTRYGGDCYGYCLLAAGYVDLVVEADLQPYDIIPLIPLIEAAGGVVTDWDGKPPFQGGRVVAAANRTLHRLALDILRGPLAKSS